jgi:hypothetical protein
MKNNSFSERLTAAVLADDRAAAFKVAADAMQEIGQQLMDIINQYSTADLPFCIAAMLVTSSSMNGMLPDSGREMVRNLVSSCSTVVIRKDELKKQMQEDST